MIVGNKDSTAPEFVLANNIYNLLINMNNDYVMLALVA